MEKVVRRSAAKGGQKIETFFVCLTSSWSEKFSECLRVRTTGLF